jgi:hypothetical protein
VSADVQETLRSLLDRWSSHVAERGVDQSHREQVEEQLRGHASSLMSAGLDADEAFLVALKRVSESDPASREFARDFADGLLAAPGDVRSEQLSGRAATRGLLVMLGLGVAAGIAIKVPAFLGYPFDGPGIEIYLVNLSLFVLPFLLVYFAWAHRPPRRQLIAVSAVLAAGAVFANAYPVAAGGSTRVLTALHLPVLLWLALGVASAGGEWLSVSKRMEYVRFTGEWFITYVLIALGGGVLSAITVGVFGAIGADAGRFVSEWMIPCGAMGAVLVAAWLVETRRNLVGGFAPMLARVFTPLFALMLLASLVGVVGTRGFVNVEREALIIFDVLLVLVVALLLYGISARDPHAAPGFFDRIQLALVACALAVDVFALVSIAVRLSQFGSSANKVAALGLNLILLVNLVWSAYLQTGFLRSRRSITEVERWQMRYLPVYAAWAAIVVVVFPPLFGFK